jgi:S1-C subfamily serine protease
VSFLLGVTPALAIVGEGGRDAGLEAQSAMVLKRAGKAAGFCSAVVLSERVVLTAAHCVGAPSDTKLHWRGADGAPVLADVARVAVHSGFRADAARTRERSVDLALVLVSKPLPPRFSRASLSDRGSLALGERVRIGGYGVSREGEGATSGVFRTADLVIRAPLSRLLGWAESGDGRKLGACTGDSGGGMFDRSGDVVGIVAWSSGQGARGCGGVTQSILVGPQRDWIDRVIAGWR